MSISTEFLRFHDILQNLVLAGDYFYFLIQIQVCKEFWQICRSCKIDWPLEQAAKLHCNMKTILLMMYNQWLIIEHMMHRVTDVFIF